MTGEMWKNKPPFPVVLNKAVSDDIARQCKHYIRRGVINFVSLVLQLVCIIWILWPTMFSGLLGFSAPVSLTPVSMAPAPVVEYGCGRVHNASACRVKRGTRVLVWKIEESIETRYQAS